MADVSTDILTVEGSSLTKFSDNTSWPSRFWHCQSLLGSCKVWGGAEPWGSGLWQHRHSNLRGRGITIGTEIKSKEKRNGFSITDLMTKINVHLTMHYTNCFPRECELYLNMVSESGTTTYNKFFYGIAATPFIKWNGPGPCAHLGLHETLNVDCRSLNVDCRSWQTKSY
jgi:hypothetical protein